MTTRSDKHGARPEQRLLDVAAAYEVEDEGDGQSTTAAITQARRWPRRTPRASARRPMPARATRAPAAWLAPQREHLEHQMEPVRAAVA